MAFILKSTRLLYNLFEFARPASGLVGKKKSFLFLECQKIFNFSESNTVRTIALSTKNVEDDQLNVSANFEKKIYQLNLEISKKRVFKEDVQTIFEHLKQNGEMTYSQIILLLKCCTDTTFMCSEKERLEMAEEIWKTAIKLGTKFDKNHYNALLTAFVVNNHEFSYRKFLDDMKNADVQPDIITYRQLLRATCQQGDILGAKDLLKEMRNLNYSINENDFNSLILGYSKIGDFEKANEIFMIMEEKNLQPTSRSYTYLLCGYIENGKFEKFEELFNNLLEKENTILTDFDLLEILYCLALNKQDKYNDMIIKNLSNSNLLKKTLSNFIQRLLHKKLDSLAFKLLEMSDFADEPYFYTPTTSRHIINHFIYYRDPNQILEICEEFEKKGLARAAVSYSLQKVFFCKDEYFALNFIQEMKARNFFIRPHFFWPIIIKASKKGNEEMLTILKKLPIGALNQRDTIVNIILPNYKFSEAWTEDIEKLAKTGIRKNNLLSCIAYYLLENFKVDEVEQLVSTYEVPIRRPKQFLFLLFECLFRNPDKVEQVVNIMFNINDESNLEALMEESNNLELKPESFLDLAVVHLMKTLKDKETAQRVLEIMLEKKMGVSPETGSLIIEYLPDHNVEELVKKLTDPNLKVELNADLAERKSKIKIAESSFLYRENEELNILESLKNCIFHMLRLARNRKYEKAFEIGESFAQQNKEMSEKVIKSNKQLFINFLNEVSKEKDTTLLDEAFKLGVKLGILNNKKRDNGLYLLHCLKCSNISKAFEIFKKELLETGKIVGGVDLCTKCISEGKSEMVQQITELITENVNKNVAFSHLAIAFMGIGEIEKARKILDSAGFEFSNYLFIVKLKTWYIFKRAEEFESYLEVFRNIEGVEESVLFLYKIIISKYAEENNIDKVNQLCKEVQEKNIADEEFNIKISDFQENQNASHLYQFIKADFTKEKPRQSTNINFLNRIFNDMNSEERYLLAINKIVSNQEALYLAVKFATEGDVERACSITEKYSLEKSIKKIATAFLRSKKINEYIEFLDYFATKWDFTTVSNCFRIGCLIPALQSNDEYFQKYKSLVLKCADETHFSLPVITYFVTCVKLPGKLADAEEIFDKYSNYFKGLPFSQINEAVEMTELTSNFYENVLFSKKLKEYFSDQLPMFYSKLINLNSEEDNVDKALHYMEQAKRDGVEKQLEKNAVSLLKTKLKEKGRDFPYVEENVS